MNKLIILLLTVLILGCTTTKGVDQRPYMDLCSNSICRQLNSTYVSGKIEYGLLTASFYCTCYNETSTFTYTFTRDLFGYTEEIK